MDTNSISKIITNSSETIAPLRFTKKTIPRSRYVLEYEYAIQQTNEHEAKIIFHFTKASRNDLAIIAERLAKCVMRSNLSTSRAVSGFNPLFKGNWDFILYNIPMLRTVDMLDTLLKEIDKL